MNVKFVSLKFRNILSYGNKESEFLFKDGLTSITGKNGHGKSTIIDILSYNLFGQPYRKVKINELINRINKKGMYTESKFLINDIEYCIKRGIKPNTLQILREGEELELLSSKKLIQDEINEILGINFNLFKQIIALAVNTNKPFLTLSAGEKRSIIETIFSIDVFGEMTKDIKNKLRDLKVDVKIKDAELKGVENSWGHLVKQKDSVDNATTNFEKTKSRDIEKINEIISGYEVKLTKNEGNVEIASSKLKELDSRLVDVKVLKDQRTSLNKEISVNQYKIKELNNSDKTLNSDYCNTCGTVLSEEHREKHLKDNEDNRLDLLEDNKSKNTLVSDLDQKIDLDQEIRQKISEINTARDKAMDRISWISTELTKAETNKEDIVNRTLDLNIEDYTKLIKDKYDEKEILTNVVDDIHNDIDVNSTMIDILSETGVKSHFIRKLLPILNKKVNEYFESFEMPFIFNFNESLEEEIIAVDGNNTSYFACSEGEKKRVDISILLSFIDTIKEISNFDCNLLFFDELLDSAVDSENLSLIVNAIKEMTIKKPTLGIYVISHRSHSGIWDNIIEINKTNHFSDIKIVE
jgi:DNA repair exonuclease SbcCD ATPase subunit